jgi:polar amino acid transport system substrate-binding protein
MTGSFLRLAWLVALTFFWLPAIAGSCVKTVRWAVAPPYSFKDQSGAIRGLHIDLAREALRRMNCETRYLDLPWARALHELEAGRLDILPGSADTHERATIALFSRPTNRARNVVFVRADSEKKYRLSKLADLTGTDFRLAVRHGASYGVEYDALLNQPQFKNRLTFVSSAMTALQMMAAGRVEGLVADELTGILGIQELGLGQVIHQSQLVTSSEADFMAFSRVTTDAAFVQRFNQALLAMQADGSYKKMLETYLPCTISMEKLGCR